MKKLVAVLLVLCMVLTMAFAVAEESTVSTYIMIGATDADGNTVDITTAELPVLILVIDSATNQCAFGTEDASVEGTYEMVTAEDGTIALTVSLTDGSEYVMAYSVDEDIFALIDSENNLVYILANLATLAAEAA